MHKNIANCYVRFKIIFDILSLYSIVEKNFEKHFLFYFFEILFFNDTKLKLVLQTTKIKISKY